jgi:hypothetical protein
MTAQIEAMIATNKARPTRSFSGGPRMNRSVTSTLFLGILALLLVWSPAYAAKQVATVVAARGDIQALDAKGKSRPLAPQAPIFEEDTIKTGAHSRAQIMFTDNTLINLGNATTMKIAEYRWQPEQNDGALKTQVKEGTFRVMGGALSKTAPQNFKTETPSATIGIRGSMYAGVVTPNFLSVVFQGGKGIEITNPFGTVEISKPGYGTKVTLDKPPLPPMKFTAQEMGEMNKALSGNGNGEKEEKKEEKKEKGEDKGKKEDKGPEKPPAAKEEQSTAPAPAESQTTSTAPTPAPETAPAPADTLTTNGWATTTIDPALDTAPTLAPTPIPFPVSLVPTDLLNSAISDTTQTDLITTATATAAATTFTTNGFYRAFRRDSNHAIFLDWESGSFTTSLSGSGVFEGTLTDDGSSSVDNIPNFPVPIGPYTPSASGSSFTLPVSYNDPIAGPITMTATTYVAPLGEFFYTTLRHDQTASPDNLLIGFLGYAGVASSSIPSTGIDAYLGKLLHNSIPAPNAYDADLEETFIEVSYYNKRFIGRSKDPYANDHGGATFFGTLNNNGTASNIIVLASGDSQAPAPDYVTTAYGNSGTATFYGGSNAGIGFTVSGGDYSIATGAQLASWQATGAAIRAEPTEYITSYPTAPITYTGYLMGVGDDISTGKVSRIFMNTSPTLSMTVNPTTGTVSGFFSANEITGGTPLSSITIGNLTDLTKSAYILNDQMVAILSDSDPSYTLKSQGNFLTTAGPDNYITQTSTEDLTWGYWELAYTDPNGSSNDHIFSSQSFFVAGKPTDPAYITPRLGQNLTGTYDGKAYGVRISEVSTGIFDATPLTNGSTHLAINFQNTASAVNGNITFSEATLAINSPASAVHSSGFNAVIPTVTVAGTPISTTYSQVNGGFYGLTANAVGGNFRAEINNTRYLGVFGGSGSIQ